VAVYELAFRHFASFLKPKSRAKKSVSQVKIGQIVHHTVLFFKRSRHLGHPIMLSATEDQNLLGMQKWDFKPLFCRALYGPSFENKHR